jgi:hypothetical protein
MVMNVMLQVYTVRNFKTYPTRSEEHLARARRSFSYLFSVPYINLISFYSCWNKTRSIYNLP